MSKLSVYTGKKWIDDRKIYGRSFELASDLTTTTTIATIDTGLEPVGILKYSTSAWYIINQSASGTSTDYAFIKYDDITGVISGGSSGGSLTLKAGTKLTIEYVK